MDDRRKVFMVVCCWTVFVHSMSASDGRNVPDYGELIKVLKAVQNDSGSLWKPMEPQNGYEAKGSAEESDSARIPIPKRQRGQRKRFEGEDENPWMERSLYEGEIENPWMQRSLYEGESENPLMERSLYDGEIENPWMQRSLYEGESENPWMEKSLYEGESENPWMQRSLYEGEDENPWMQKSRHKAYTRQNPIRQRGVYGTDDRRGHHVHRQQHDPDYDQNEISADDLLDQLIELLREEEE